MTKKSERMKGFYGMNYEDAAKATIELLKKNIDHKPVENSIEKEQDDGGWTRIGETLQNIGSNLVELSTLFEKQIRDMIK